MSPSKKVAKKKYPLPPPVDFETWKLALARCIGPRSNEAMALQHWAEGRAAYYTMLGETEEASADSILRYAYFMTQPKIPSGVEKKKVEAVVRKLRDLLPGMVSALGGIKTCNPQILAEDGLLPLDLSGLTVLLEEAALGVRGTLLLFDRPYERSPDVLTYCVVFLSELQSKEVSEIEALSLCRLLMKAHGFSDEELEVFLRHSRDAGTVRKRRRAAFGKVLKASEAYFELMRQHNKMSRIDLTLFERKQD